MILIWEADSSPIEFLSLSVNGEEIVSGMRKRDGGLFKTTLEPVTPKVEIEINAITTSNSTLQLYHERFGHQDRRHVKTLLENEFLIKVNVDNFLCEPCIFGKAHRRPFGKRMKANFPGELVSGPLDLTFQKKRYVAIFKDVFHSTDMLFC
jgi:hypothetical protein